LNRKMRHFLKTAFIILLSGMFLILFFNQYQNKIIMFFQDDMENSLESSVRQTASSTRNRVNGIVSVLQILSQTLEDKNVALTEDNVLLPLNKVKETAGFSRMAVVFPDGSCVDDDGAKIQISGSASYKKMMENSSFVSNLIVSEWDGNQCIVIGVPVSRDSRVIGGILAYLSTEAVGEMLEINTLDKRSNAFIIDKSGTVISSSTPKFVKESIFTNSNLFDIPKESIQKIKTDIQNNKGGTLSYSSENVEHYARYEPVGINDWFLLQSVPLSMYGLKSKLIIRQTADLSLKLIAVLLMLGAYAVVREYRNGKALQQINDKLNHTRAELESFVADLPGGAFRYTADEKEEFQFISDGMLRIFGYSKEEFAEKTQNKFENIIYPNDRKRTRNSIHRQICKSKFAEVKYRIVTADGDIRWMLNRVKVVTDVNGDKEFCAVVVDITNSKKAHKRARDAMIQLETLSNSIPGGVAQFLYHNGRLTLMYANEGFYRLTGYEKSEYTQLPDGQGIWHAHPYDLKNLQQLMEKQIKRQEALSAEYRLLRKDSDIIWISLSGTRTVNSRGQVIYQCIFTDITSFKKTQMELELEKERYEIAENLSDDILFEYNIFADYMEFSPLFTALTGRYPRIADFTKAIYEDQIIHIEDLSDVQAFVEKVNLGNAEDGVEFRFNTGQGEFIWHRVKAKIIFDECGRPSRMIGKAYNIDAQKKEMQRLTDKSQRDSLTNLYNKVAAQSQIEDDLKNANPGSRHVLMIIDIDDFKSINDSFGHLVGDTVITEISNSLQMLFRTSDVVGRIGGDEFIVFLRDVPADYTISQKAKAICRIFRNTREGKRLHYHVSGSIGIALCPMDGTTYQELFSKADTALYRAKNLGKDGYAFYNQELNLES
jgi:diguanylate cyclase (GGDEF)-like protein/PAS domain S-box-containing protein